MRLERLRWSWKEASVCASPEDIDEDIVGTECDCRYGLMRCESGRRVEAMATIRLACLSSGITSSILLPGLDRPSALVVNCAKYQAKRALWVTALDTHPAGPSEYRLPFNADQLETLPY